MTVMAKEKTHQPVLLEEALSFLHVKEGGTYVDGTAGGGGHSEAIAKAIGPKGHLVCIDQDLEALEGADGGLDKILEQLRLWRRRVES